MKPINKVCGKDDLRPGMHFFQVKNGFVSATNGSILVRFPINELFGEMHLDPIITSSEELYFKGRDWLDGKFHNCHMIFRDELSFKTDKGLSIIAKTSEQMAEIGRFPDVDPVIPGEALPLSNVNRIGFDFLLLHDLCSAFGKVDPYKFVYYFYGENKCILIKHPDSAGFGLLMPTCIDNFYTHPFQSTQTDET